MATSLNPHQSITHFFDIVMLIFTLRVESTADNMQMKGDFAEIGWMDGCSG